MLLLPKKEVSSGSSFTLSFFIHATKRSFLSSFFLWRDHFQLRLTVCCISCLQWWPPPFSTWWGNGISPVTLLPCYNWCSAVQALSLSYTIRQPCYLHSTLRPCSSHWLFCHPPFYQRFALGKIRYFHGWLVSENRAAAAIIGTFDRGVLSSFAIKFQSMTVRKCRGAQKIPKESRMLVTDAILFNDCKTRLLHTALDTPVEGLEGFGYHGFISPVGGTVIVQNTRSLWSVAAVRELWPLFLQFSPRVPIITIQSTFLCLRHEWRIFGSSIDRDSLCLIALP